MSNQEFREIITSAIRYWEHGRIIYNIVLALVVAIIAFVNWEVATTHFSLDKLLSLFMLAVLANIAYCAAYVADLLAQLSDFRQTWVRSRWVLWAIGTAFGCIWAQFIVRGSIGAT
jgi:hypothetical protein